MCLEMLNMFIFINNLINCTKQYQKLQQFPVDVQKEKPQLDLLIVRSCMNSTVLLIMFNNKWVSEKIVLVPPYVKMPI